MNAPVALSSLSATTPRQVLVSGRAADAVSGRGIDGAILALTYDPTGDGSFSALPARLGRRDDGWFSFDLIPDQLRAPDAAGSPVLRVSVSAPGYGEGSGETMVTPAQLAIAQDSHVVAGQQATFSRCRGAPFRIDVALAPQAVALEGEVFERGDPDHPADGATVSAVAPAGSSTITDADGAFRIDALPVAAAVTIRVSHGGSDIDHVVHPDFSQRINRAVFATA